MSDKMRRSLSRAAGDGDIVAARQLVRMLEREAQPGAQPSEAFGGFDMIRSATMSGLVYVQARAHLRAGFNHDALIDRLAEAAGLARYEVTATTLQPSSDGSYLISVALQERRD